MSLHKQIKLEKTAFEMSTDSHRHLLQHQKLSDRTRFNLDAQINEQPMEFDKLKQFSDFSTMYNREPIEQNAQNQLNAAKQLIEKVIMANIMPLYLTNLLGNCSNKLTSFPTVENTPQLKKDLTQKSIEKIVSTTITNKLTTDRSAKSPPNQSVHPYQRQTPKIKSSSSIKVSPLPTEPAPTAAPAKMVRGQEEWVNNSRHKSFISQILKCLECSQSFETLQDLSVHMLNSNHFVKLYSSLDNNSNDVSSHKTSNHKASYSADLNRLFYNSPMKKKQAESTPQLSKSTKQIDHNTNSSASACKLKNVIPLRTNCQICNKAFDNEPSRTNVSIHYSSQTPQLPPLVRLIQHLQNTHKINHICTNCGSYFDTVDQLINHLVEENHNHHPYGGLQRQQNPQQHHHQQTKYNSVKKNSYKQLKNSLKVNTNTTAEVARRSEYSISSESKSLSISISPTLSSSDSLSAYSSYSANSSPSSFVFETANINKQKLEVSKILQD